LLHHPQNNLSQAKEHMQVNVDSCSLPSQPSNHPDEGRRRDALDGIGEQSKPSFVVLNRQRRLHLTSTAPSSSHHPCPLPLTMQINKHHASKIDTGGGGNDWLWAVKHGEAAPRGQLLFDGRRCYCIVVGGDKGWGGGIRW
jgi:hypothetical protein